MNEVLFKVLCHNACVVIQTAIHELGVEPDFSRDLFRTFEKAGNGVTANSTMMAVRADPRAPYHVFCVARDGETFGSTDGGRRDYLDGVSAA